MFLCDPGFQNQDMGRLQQFLSCCDLFNSEQGRCSLWSRRLGCSGLGIH